MQVSKWGNSLAVRLPASVVEVLDLKEGDDIEKFMWWRHAPWRSRKPPELESSRSPEKISRAATSGFQVGPS